MVCRGAAAADRGEVTGVRREAAAYGEFLTYRVHALFPRLHEDMQAVPCPRIELSDAMPDLGIPCTHSRTKSYHNFWCPADHFGATPRSSGHSLWRANHAHTGALFSCPLP